MDDPSGLNLRFGVLAIPMSTVAHRAEETCNFPHPQCGGSHIEHLREFAYAHSIHCSKFVRLLASDRLQRECKVIEVLPLSMQGRVRCINLCNPGCNVSRSDRDHDAARGRCTICTGECSIGMEPAHVGRAVSAVAARGALGGREHILSFEVSNRLRRDLRGAGKIDGRLFPSIPRTS